MRSGWVFLFILFTVSIAVRIPSGYSTWQSSETAFNYVVQQGKICQVVVKHNRLMFRVVNESNENLMWSPLGSLVNNEEATPLLCFWYDNYPVFIVKFKRSGKTVITLENVRTSYDLTIPHELIAYDYVYDMIYTYSNGQMYRLMTRRFVDAVKRKDIQWQAYIQPYYWRDIAYRDCSDMIATNSQVFLLCSKYLIHVNGAGYSIVDKYDSNKFNYTLINDLTYTNSSKFD